MLLNLPLNHYLLFEGVITADLVKRQCEVSEASFCTTNSHYFLRFFVTYLSLTMSACIRYRVNNL